MGVFDYYLLHANTIILAVLAACVGIVFYLFSLRNSRLPPGPYGLPFIGIYPFLSDQPHADLMKLAEKYGDIFSFTLFGQTFIHLNSIDVIKEAFVKQSNVFSGRDTNFNLLNCIDGVQGIAQIEGPEWKEDRQFFLQNVKTFGFGKVELEPYIHENVTKLIQRIEEEKGNSVFALNMLSIAAMNVAGKIFMSLEYDGLDDPDFVRVQRNAFSFAIEFDSPRLLLSGPIYEYLLFRFSRHYKDYVQTKDAWYAASEKVIEEHKKTFDKDNIRDFTDRFLEAMYEKQKKGESTKSLTHDKLRSILINIYLDGMMTLTAALNNYMQILAQNEDAQDKVKEELDMFVGSERLPSWTDRSSLPYTQATIQELNRMGPVLPLAVPHKCTEDVEFHGYKFPKNTAVLSNIWAVHYNPEIWPNPEKFEPERHLSVDGKSKQDSVIAFGVGKRSCIGELLAKMEVFIYVACILQKFRLRLPPGVSPEDCKGKNLFKICFVPRN